MNRDTTIKRDDPASGRRDENDDLNDPEFQNRQREESGVQHKDRRDAPNDQRKQQPPNRNPGNKPGEPKRPTM